MGTNKAPRGALLVHGALLVWRAHEPSESMAALLQGGEGEIATREGGQLRKCLLLSMYQALSVCAQRRDAYWLCGAIFRSLPHEKRSNQGTAQTERAHTGPACTQLGWGKRYRCLDRFYELLASQIRAESPDMNAL